jgi:hypothetical protein
MESVVIAVVADRDGCEQTAAEVRCDSFRPNILDEILPALMQATRSNLAVSTDLELGQFGVEIAIRLSSDQATRPALHISREALATLARAGASLDFDPYC